MLFDLVERFSSFNVQAVKPSMRSFLHTVQKNQMLMMTPNSLGRSGVIKSFIKHTTPLKIDSKVKWSFLTQTDKTTQQLTQLYQGNPVFLI